LDVRILFRTLIVPFQQGHAAGQAIADIDDLNLCGDREEEPVQPAPR
jgi:hypothetical protein